MFPPGHFALGYFAAVMAKRVNNSKFNVAIVWGISILPDIDCFIPGLVHRGPTHSAVMAIFLFIPVLFF